MSTAPPRLAFDELRSAPAAHTHARAVRFQDVDAAGIAFFARILEYFHDAWAEFLTSVGHPLHEVIGARGIGAPLRHIEGDFLKPLRFGDPIHVSIVVFRLDGEDLLVGYRVDAPDGTAVAVGQSLHAFLDLKTFRRMTPPEWAVALSTKLAGDRQWP